jgi:hypothetical protein
VTELTDEQDFPTPSREATAHHEAGHVVAWWALGVDVVAAEIDLGPPRFGSVTRDRDATPSKTESAVSELASWASEAVFKGEDPRRPSRPDQTLELLGFEITSLSPGELVAARETAVELVTASAETVAAVASALLEKGRLTRADLEDLRPERA